MTSQQPRHPASAGAALRVIPLLLLIILAMAGLRGAVGTPKWTGSHGADMATGGTLFVVFAVLLAVIMARRRTALRGSAAQAEILDPQGKLRVTLQWLLIAAMIADIVGIIVGLHLKLPKPVAKPPQRPPQQAGPRTPKVPVPHGGGSGGSFPLAGILWALLIIVLIIVILLLVRWLRRQARMPVLSREDDFLAEDSETLRDAVESGRAALRTYDDARAAIIACYAAMESSLAEHGAARRAADTPDELLARATQTGIVRGTAPARLTALFYEARFSSHPMNQSQREAAEQALNELASALDSQRAEPQETGA
jgi:hypothetical protein